MFIAKYMQDTYQLLFNSDCKEAVKDFVTKGYEEKILPLPVSLTTPHYWLTLKPFFHL